MALRGKSAPGIGVGLLGLGVVGSGVAKVLLERKQQLANKVGQVLHLKRVLIRNSAKARPSFMPRELLTTNPEDVFTDPDIAVVIEVMGGEQPAKGYIERALSSKKHVVTANKEVMAKRGPELLQLASRKEAQLLFEASVGGGIPIIGPLQRDLQANEISSIRAIINGTTNFILTSMANGGMDYQTALKRAQEMGYAEPDPSMDVEAIDAAYKLAILASLAFHTRVHFSDVFHEGITRLDAKDFLYARELGFAVKLLAIAKREDGRVQVRVHPAFVPQDNLLAKVDGAYNAIEVEGDLVGRVTFHGMGAGSQPTTSAVLGDLLSVARNITAGVGYVAPSGTNRRLPLRAIGELQTRYYLRTTVADQPGVLAQISRILGDLKISIASVIQKDAQPETQTAELVVMTHPSMEKALQEAREQILKLQVVKEINNLIRVEPA